VAATPSVKIVKTFTYRGVTRTFSNRYHFTGGTPPDATHWHTLFDNIVTAEKAIYTNVVTITEAFGYAAGSEVPVASKNYTTVGTQGENGIRPPGDCAAVIRYSTSARSSKNHPVYLFNYHHDPQCTSNTLPDTLLAGYVTTLGTYAGLWTGAGFSDGATSYNRAGPNGATATGYIVEPMVSHRDLPR